MKSYKQTDMTKIDCFAFRERSCAILTERICDSRKCRFYKTEEEYKKTRTPSRLTTDEQRILQGKGINPDGWLLVDSTKLALIVCNIKTKETRTIPKRGGTND